jgi:methionyl-tRNA synthetase
VKSFYVTTPIYYVNDLPHIGHTYTTVVADVIARYQRMSGRRVFFLTGTDEHGQKIERAAVKQGIEPKELADRVVARYHDLWKRMEITYDDFIRTTDDRHRRGVMKIFQRVADKGDIYLDAYEGMYCTGCEAFYPESQVQEGRCPELGHPVERVREESYFFRLSRYQEPLLKLFANHPEFVRPDFRLNEVRRFVEMGLKDLSISRTSFKWGIPFPGDPRHILYVWFDALCNYVTALDYGEGGDLYRDFWPADLHLVGKDIIRFHAVYWPAFLMSADLPLPKTVYAHGWWLRSDSKMSKTKGNIVDPLPLIADFGPDALRYFMMREMAFGQDAQYSEEALVDRINNDLANDLGNLLSRLLKMIEDFSGGVIPAPAAPPEQAREVAALAAAAGGAVAAYRAAFDDYRFHEGLAAVAGLVSETNRHIVRWEPWVLARDPARRPLLDTVLFCAAEAIRIVAVALAPVMPSASQEIWSQLGCPGRIGARRLDALSWGGLAPGQPIRRGAPLFPRVDKSAHFASATSTSSTVTAMTKEIRMEQPDRPIRQAPPATPAAPATPTTPAGAESGTITIEDFMKIKLRSGKVLAAEKVAGADRLLKLTVDIGAEQRTVLAGIALQYAPEALVGKCVVLVANLAPRKMRGIESQGMILAADDDGKPIVATFESDVPPGAVVR